MVRGDGTGEAAQGSVVDRCNPVTRTRPHVHVYLSCNLFRGLFRGLFRERFRREMELTRRLAGPGIVKVHGMHEHGGRPFFAMERLRGTTLRRRLSAGLLRPAQARRIAREICEALHRPHSAGAVHRDLKPENVFLGAGQVKLLDFGLSKCVGDARLTASSRVLGTPGYIAPEVWEGDPAVSFR